MVQQRVLRVVGGVLFALGIMLGVLFWGSAVWADIEAFLFDSSLSADASLPSLRCPVLVTTAEGSEIKATFTNPLDRAIRPKYTFHVTDGFVSLMREDAAFLQLDPGVHKQLSWQVTAEDAAWEYFILARVYLQRAYPLPSRTSSCGIVVLNVPSMNGNQLAVVVILVTVLLTGLGFYLWYAACRPLEGRRMQEARGRMALMILAGLGIVFGTLGFWLPGLICLIVLVLLIVVMLARAAMETA